MCVRTEWRIWKSNVNIFRWVCYAMCSSFWYFSFFSITFLPITVYTGFNLFCRYRQFFFFTIDFKTSPPRRIFLWFKFLFSFYFLFFFRKEKKWADNELSYVGQLRIFSVNILRVFHTFTYVHDAGVNIKTQCDFEWLSWDDSSSIKDLICRNRIVYIYLIKSILLK